MQPPLTAHHALQLATQAVPIIKHLSRTNKTMSLKEFGQAIGLVRKAWQPIHREQIDIVLSVARDAFSRLDESLELHRVKHPDNHAGHWYRGYWITEDIRA
jgi:hypothetical protein